jgi:cobalt-zinc-cadmium efflux system membrane fusion protein
MKQKWAASAIWTVLGMTVAGLLVWRLPGSAATPATASTRPDIAANGEQPATTKPSLDADTLRYAAASPQLTMIQVRPVQTSRVPLADTLSARVVYDEDSTARIGVAVSGRVVRIAAAPGDSVKAGQLLAEIDSPEVGTANADLDKARADEQRKQLAADRARSLLPGDAIPQKDWESAQADLAQASAETLRAQQRVNNLHPLGGVGSGQRLGLFSPIAGVVTERNITPALEVSPGMSAPMFVVSDPKRLWLLIDLPEKLLSIVKLGSMVEVESEAFPAQRFAAKLVQLGQVVDPNSRRVTLRARLDNPGRQLLPEMFVRAHLLQDSGEGIRLPNSAIVNRGVYAYVFVETRPGEFHLRQVTLSVQGGDFSYVASGLHADERVVTGGALLLDAELSASAGSKL